MERGNKTRPGKEEGREAILGTAVMEQRSTANCIVGHKTGDSEGHGELHCWPQNGGFETETK